MVTGKNKEEFERFYKKKYAPKNYLSNSEYWRTSLNIFYNMPFEMQIGEYLSYYDSIGITIHVGQNYIHNFGFTIDGETYGSYKEETRPEAYKEAFKKADKLVNETLNQ